MTLSIRSTLLAVALLSFGMLHAQSTNFSYTGTVVTYTITTTGDYQFTASGASGAASQTGKTGGLGASVGEMIYLTNGTILSIAVGGAGINTATASYEGGGGGGGTFVYIDTNTPLLIAGGGGGASGSYLSPYGYAGGPGITNQSGSGSGGSGGLGGAAGGAGFFGSGGNAYGASSATGGSGPTNFAGGSGYYGSGNAGGFGGGGGGAMAGGGGGGYTGGSGGAPGGGAGSGGSSYYTLGALFLTGSIGANSGNGSFSLALVPDLVIGSNSTSQSLSLTTGTNSFSNTYIGYNAGDSNNVLTVANANTLLSNAVRLYVGYDGSSNSLIISNGGQILTSYLREGHDVGSSNNSILVTGTNSLLESGINGATNISMRIGANSSHDSLVVNNGGTVLSLDSISIGNGATSGTDASYNTVLVYGSGTLSAVTNIYVGYAGQGNSMVVSNGGTASDDIGYIGYSNTASNNIVTVTGSNALWSNSSSVVVGEYGSGNTLIVSNGGSVFATNGGIYIGDAPGSSNNSVTISGTNSKITSSELGVGAGGAGASLNKLSVLGGAVVTALYQIDIGWINSTNNQVLVSGTGSTLDGSLGSLYVGGAGGPNDVGNSLMISNGGQVLAFDCDVGAWQNTFSNSIVVSGTNSALDCSSRLLIGGFGNNNSLTISNGGGVTSVGLSIGQGADDLYVPGHGIVAHYPQNSNNSVVVTGANSSLTNTGDLYVGYYGSSNSLNISNGGHVINLGNAYVGYTNTVTNPTPYFSSNNSVVVTGADSIWTNSGSLSVGYAGSSNSMLISNGGKVYNAGGYIGREATALGNLVTVTGSNSSWINSGDLYVGFAGQSNRLVISNGGFVSNVNGFDDGEDPYDAYNSVVVTGAGSRWSNSGTLTFGQAGHDNSLVISNGGVVTVGGQSVVGDQYTASNNAVLVAGAGSLWSIATNLIIGNEASFNSMTISAYSTVSVTDPNGHSWIGASNSSSNNSVMVTQHARWINQGTIQVGVSGSFNSLTVSGASTVTSGRNFYIGNDTNSHQNSVIVTGAGSLLECGQNFTIGRGYSNHLTISNGGMVTAGGFAMIGRIEGASNNCMLVTGMGSSWSNGGNLTIGVAGSGNALLVSNGGMVAVGSNSILGDSNTSYGNIALITGAGSLWSNAGTVTIGNQGSGTATVADGGMIVASQIQIGQYGELDFGRINQSDSAGSVVGDIVFTAPSDANFGINFNQTNTLYLSNNVSGDGWICALGTGTTVMSGSNSYSQYTIIDRGTVVAASTNALGTGYLKIGGTLDQATLRLATNLTVGDFTWRSNGVIALTAGSQTLTVSAMTNAAVGSTNFFEFINPSMNNGTNTLINFTSQTGFTTNSFSVEKISGYSFALTNNSVQAYMATNANVVISMPVVVTNPFTAESVTIAGPAGCISGTGPITAPVTNGGTMIPGLTSGTPGTMTINGTYTQLSSGTLQIQVGNGLNSLLSVNGATSLGGTLALTPVGGHQFQYGEKIVFLSASEITGAFSTVEVPNGFRGRVKVFGDPMLEVIMAPASYTQLAQNQNQLNVATALNSFIPYTSGDQQVVSTALDNLTASQYNQAFNAIMPTFYQQIATIAFNQANAQNMELNQRLWGLRVAEGGGFSMSGIADNYAMLQEGIGDGPGKGVLDSKKDILRPGLDNHWGMFVDGNGIFAQANSANMLPGYNSESGGVTTGLTYKWNKNVASGIYAGYQGTYTKSGSNGSGLGTGSSLIDNAVRFGVFGTYGQENGKGLYANALAGGAYHNMQATRVIQFTGLNRSANSSPGAGELDTMLATGYDLQKGKFTYGPTASLQYTYLGVNSVNETGAQSLNFNSGGWSSSSMLSSVGAHAAYNWQAGRSILVVPQISLNWQHEFMQNPYAISGNLGGTSPTFANWSATPIRDFLYTGVGFTVEFGKRWDTSFFYNAAAGNSDLVSQNIFWSAGVKF